MAIVHVTECPPIPPRPLEGHKGMFGRVLVVGGSEGMIGAPALAGTAALRSGAGLVELGVPRSILAAVLTITPELIAIGLGSTAAEQRLIDAAQKADAVVIGPGLGRAVQAEARLAKLIQLDKPMVVDADGLNMLSAGEKWPATFRARAVLTPHPGEMARLAKLIGRDKVPTDDAGRLEIAAEAARAFGQVIVLKGNRTVVTDGARAYVNTTGDSSLSKAGTGDVLSGIIGTFLAQEMAQFDAAVAAVWIHGRAGEIAGHTFGRRSALATDLINSISQAIADYEGL